MDLGSTFKELVDEVNKKAEVVANSSEDTTATLSKLKVNGTNYAVPSGGGGSVTVDSSLSTTSTNPVQNKVITEEVNSINSLLQDHDDVIRMLDLDYVATAGNNTISGTKNFTGTLNYGGVEVAKLYEWVTPSSNTATSGTVGTHTIDISSLITGWESTHIYEAVVVIEAYCTATAYMSTFTDIFSNVLADQRFSSNGRQGGGIYTLPVTRYINYTISTAGLNTLKISIVKLRRIK